MKILFALMLATLISAENPRQVLLFYSENGAEMHQSQLDVLNKHQKDVRERDIKIKSISNSAQDKGEWKKWNIDPKNPFTFILIGRDGGEKLRSTEIVSAEKLFGLIDAMPMRRSEVERGNR